MQKENLTGMTQKKEKKYMKKCSEGKKQAQNENLKSYEHYANKGKNCERGSDNQERIAERKIKK